MGRNNTTDIELLAGLNIESSEEEILKGIKIIEKRLKANHDARFKLNVEIDETVIKETINKLQNILKSKDLTIDTTDSIQAITREVNAMGDIVTVAKRASAEKLEFAKANEKVKNSADATDDAVNRERSAMRSMYDVDSILDSINGTGRQGASVFQRFGSSLRDAFSAYTMVNILDKSLEKVVEVGKEGIKIVKGLNDSLTSLRMATGESYESVKNLLQTYNEMAQELGSITVDVSESADEWLRQGHSVSETNELIRDSMMLSKISNLESADSTKYLTSAMQGYKVAVEDVIGIVDKLSAVDLVSATDAGGLAEAMSRTAEGAQIAGVSMDRLLGMIATVGEVTQKSMTSIGESYKTIFSRMRDIKDNKLSVIGDDGEIEDLSNVEIVLKSLGIRLRNSNQEFRNFQEVLDEVASVWNNYSSVQQAAIAKAFSGVRQQENFLVMMENWDKVVKYTDVAVNSVGTAEEKFSYYLESLEAKTNALKSSLESLATATISDEFYASVLDTTKVIVDMTRESGILKGALVGLTTTGAIYTFQHLATYLRDATQEFANLGEAMQITRNANGTVTDMQRLIDLTGGLAESQTRLLFNTQNLTQAQRTAILVNQYMAQGMSQDVARATAEATLQTWGFTTAQQGATRAVITLRNTLRGLWTTLLANPIVLITSAVTLGVAAFNKYKQAQAEAAQEARKQAQESANHVQSLLDLKKQLDEGTTSTEDLTTALREQLRTMGYTETQIDDLIKKYNGLSGAMDEATRKALEQAKTDAYADMSASSKAFLSDMKSSNIGTYYAQNKELSEKIQKMLEDSPAIRDGGVYRLSVNATAEEAYDYYLVLKDISRLIQETSSETGDKSLLAGSMTNPTPYYDISETLKKASESANSYGEAIERLHNADAQLALSDYLKTNDIDSKEAFDAYINSIKENTTHSEVYKNVLIRVANDAFPQFTDAVIQATGAVKDLNDNEIHLSLDESDISNFDTYKKNIKTISDALSDLNNLDTSDITSLMTEFPEYGAIFEKFGVTGVKGVGDLESALEEIAKQMMSTASNAVPELKDAIADLYKLIGNPHGSVDELTTELEDLDALMQRIKSGKSLDSKEIADYIGKYEELSDKVKVTADGYTFEEEALIDLYNTRVDVANKSIAYEIEQTNQRINSLKKTLESYKTEIAALRIVEQAYEDFDEKTNKIGTQSTSDRLSNASSDIIHAIDSDIAFSAKEEAKKAKEEAEKQALEAKKLKDEAKLKQLEEYIEQLNMMLQDNLDWKDKNKKGFEPEIVDGYEIAVERIEQSISDLDKQMDDSNITLKERNEKLKEQISLYKDLKGVHSESAKDYKKKFDKIDLDADLKTKIKEGIRFGDGSIKLDTEAEEKAFKEAEELWKNYLDANSAIFDIDAKIQETTDLLNNPPEKDNIFDWIETKLENSEKKIENFGNVANNTFLSFADRKTAFQNQIDATEAFIKELDTASEVYKKFAEEVDLSEDLKKLVRDGDLSITNAAEMNLTEKQIENIGEYTERWEDYLETVEKKEEAVKSINELNVSLFNLHKTEADLNIEEITKGIEELESTLAKSEYLNNVDKISVLDSLAGQNKELATSCYATAEALQKVYDTIIKFDPNSEEAKSLQSLIDAFTKQGQEAEEQAIEYDTQSFDAIVEKYERTLVKHENERKAIENQLAMAEARGYIDTANYYERLIASQLKTQEDNNKKLEDLNAELAKLEQDNPNFENTKVWHEKKLEIIETKEALEEGKLQLIEWNNEIRQIKWDVFDFMREQVSQVSDEAKFLIQLFENLDHFDDKGQLTDIGMAVMGQHAVQYEIALKESQTYADELVEIEKDIAKEENKNDTKLIDRKNELIGLYQDQTLAMKDAKQEMISMVEEGINLELESLQSLIDSFKEARDSAKDLYDWQKKSVSLSKNLASIEKQIAAYTNDTSEESKKKIQQLRVQLEESRDEMESAQYDRYISEQNELLTSLYDTYEEILNKRMDNVDVLFKELMQDVDKNSSKISQTVKTETEKWGYSLSTGLKDIWDAEKETDNSIDNAAGSVSGSINNGVSDLKDKLDGIQGEITDNADKNSTSIKDTINSVIDSIGGTLKENETNEESKDKITTARWTALRSLLVTIQNTLNEIHITLTNGFDKVVYTITTTGQEIAATGKEIIANLKKISSVQTKVDEPVGDSKDEVSESIDNIKQEQKPTEPESPKTYKKGDILTGVTGRWYAGSDGTGATGAVTLNDAVKWKIEKINDGAKYPYHLLSYDKNGENVGSGWVNLDSLPKYHTGLERAKTDHWGLTQDGGDEVIITKDGAVLTPIHRGDMVLNPEASRNFYQAMNDPSKFYQQYSPKVTDVPVINRNIGTMENHFEFNVTGVNDLNGLMKEVKYDLQHDRKFEDMLMDIVGSRIGDGCSMAKYKYKWK